VPQLLATFTQLEPVIAIGCSGVLALGAWLRRSLSATGALAAWAVGSLSWLGLGFGGFGVLCVFFATSTLLGRVGKSVKAPLQEHYSKGDRRDAWQVFANGGIAALCGGLALVLPSLGANVDTRWLLLASASLASANADTWATELGVLSRAEPIHLLRLRRVPRGSSGAVSLLGLGVALAGALCIALATALFCVPARSVDVVLGLTLAGWLGALCDSVLGAALQRQQRCGVCGRVVEAKVHCGQATAAWGSRSALLDNDQVNLLANALAAAWMWGWTSF
jgi:uncharacterized protein (TIGR00297 family)